MGYVSGRTLEKRVKEAGLQEVSDLLHRVSSGTTNWPGTQHIEVLPEGKEYIRNLLYAILHSLGVKDMYQVTSPQGNVLVLGVKEGRKNVVMGVYGGRCSGPLELESEEDRIDPEKGF